MVRTTIRGWVRYGLCVVATLPIGFFAGASAAHADVPVGSLVIRASTTPADASATFSFGISCTGDSEPVERKVTVSVNDGTGSAAVDGIPVDMACLVLDETVAGWRIEAANPQAVVASADGTTVEFAHSRQLAGAVSVVKTSEPSGASVGEATAPAVRRGARITYALTYTNDGDLPADAVLSDPIPAGTSYAGRPICRPACSDLPTVSAGRIQFAVPIAPGHTGRVSYAVLVADDAADGDMIGSSATAEPGRGRSGTVRHRVSVPPGGLKVAGQADRDSAPEGATVGYTIDVVNSGTAAQGDVTVTDSVPANAEYVDGSATCAAPCSASYDAARSTVSWRVGSLEAGASASGLSFKARIRPLVVNPDGSLPGTVVLNSAVASSVITPAVRSNEVKTVVEAVLGRKAVRSPPATGTPATAPTLPATGAPTGILLALGVGLIVAGVSLFSVGRAP